MDEISGPPQPPAPGADDVDRLVALENQVRQSMSRLAAWVQSQLAQAVDESRNDLAALRSEVSASIDAGREVALDAFRIELQGVLDERFHALAGQAAHAADGLVALTSSLEAESARTEAFEERVRSVVSRLTESVEALAATSTTRHGDVDALRAELRVALDGAKESVEARLAEAAAARQAEIEAVRVDLHGALDDRVGELVEGRLSDLVERRRADFEAVRAEMQADLDRQLSDARSQIAAAIAGANKRFVRAHEQLGERVEALERRIQGTDERLAEVVDVRVTEVVGGRDAGTAALRAEIAGLAETIAGAVASVEAVAASVTADQDRLERIEARLRHSEVRIDKAVEAQFARVAERRKAEVGALAAELAVVRSELATAAAAQAHDMDRAQDEIRKGLEEVAGRVDALVTGAAAAASVEAGALAPLRSDVRLLQAQVSELAAALEEARPRRRVAPAGKAPAARKAPAVTTSPAGKASASKSSASKATKRGQ